VKKYRVSRYKILEPFSNLLVFNNGLFAILYEAGIGEMEPESPATEDQEVQNQ